MFKRIFFTFFACATSCFASVIDSMTLEEKVGQILMVHFHGEEANHESRVLLQDLHIGNIIYYDWANGLHTPQQIKNLSQGLQKLAEESKQLFPLIIATDQEGGAVTRLNEGFTVFPGNKAIGETQNPELAKESAFVRGQEMLDVGINLNLAPVVDINNNPQNQVMKLRSFGETPTIVTTFALEAIRGYRAANMLSCLKHYPGHGDVAIDSHEELPALYKTREQLDTMELLPFAKLAKDADMIMTAHVMIPALDPIYCATLSPTILGILRKEMHFAGVIISDSLVMNGLLKNCSSIDEAVISAFNAGCDILLLGGKQLHGSSNGFELTVSDIQRIHSKLVESVKNGCITKERLDESLERILRLKQRIPQS